MKKTVFKTITAAILTMSAGIYTASAAFSDIPSSAWYSGSVERMEDIGCLSGYPDGTFRPNGTITRAEAAKVLQTLYDIDLTENNPFAVFMDCKGHWAEQYINKFGGYIGGVSGNSAVGRYFHPNAMCNRYDFARGIYYASELSGKSNWKYNFADISEVLDEPEAKDVVQAMGAIGIMTGDAQGYFHPNANITRAEVARVLCNIVDAGLVSVASSEKLTEAELKEIAKGLRVPNWLNVEYEQSEPYYWAAGERNLIYVRILHNGVSVATVAVDVDTLEFVKDILMYTGQ